MFKPPSIEELKPLFPAYEIDSLIASGGMGAIYHAIQTSLDREVAIKILPKEIANDPVLREAFVAEAKAMAKLNHPNLVGVYDFGEVEDMLYIVMEYVPGETLHTKTSLKKIEPEKARRIVSGILKGLKHAHDNEVLHRDLKPANILLDGSGIPKITDFGLTGQVVHEGKIFGTPAYSAPEVTAKPENVDNRTDLYAVGVILHGLLTGKEAKADTKLTSAASITKCDPLFDNIIQRSTHPIMDLRFRSAEAMRDELNKLKKESSDKPNLKTALASTSVEETTEAAQQSNYIPPEKSNFLRNLILLGLIGAGTYYLYHRVKDAKTDQDTIESIESFSKERDAKEKTDRKSAQEKAIRESESPRESLKRLQQSLLSNKKEEFPKGTHFANDRAYFLIEEPMSWSKAQEFAERHGGFLAVLKGNSANIKTISSTIPEGSTIWLGGSNKTWVDGSDWKIDVENAESFNGQALTINKDGELTTSVRKEKMPFLIEWIKEGSNIGSLAFQLKRTRDSLKSDTVIYPPGTIAAGKNRYLLIDRSLTWERAKSLAASSGGQLAKPETSEQITTLKSYLANVQDSEQSIWTGAIHKKGIWTWADKTLLDGGSDLLDQIANADNEDTAIILVAGGSAAAYSTKPFKEKSEAFLIEWLSDKDIEPNFSSSSSEESSDKDIEPNFSSSGSEESSDQSSETKAPQSITENSEPPASLTKLRAIAASTIKKYRATHKTEVLKIRTSLENEMTGILKRMSQSSQEEAQDALEDIYSDIRPGGEIPTEINEDSFNRNILRSLDSSRNKLKKSHSLLDRNLDQLHKFYTSKLKDGAENSPAFATFFEKEMEAIGSNGKDLGNYFSEDEADHAIEQTPEKKEEADNELQELLDSL